MKGDESSRKANSNLKDGFAQMAAYLVPSQQSQQQQSTGGSMFGKPGQTSLFGNNPTSNASSLFGTSIPSINADTSTPFKPAPFGATSTSTKRSSSLAN